MTTVHCPICGGQHEGDTGLTPGVTVISCPHVPPNQPFVIDTKSFADLATPAKFHKWEDIKAGMDPERRARLDAEVARDVAAIGRTAQLRELEAKGVLTHDEVEKWIADDEALYARWAALTKAVNERRLV